MSANRKKFIKKSKKPEKDLTPHQQQQYQEPILSFPLDQDKAILLCQPHKYYKVRGISQVLYSPTHYLINDTENVLIPDSNVCILQVSQAEEDNLHRKLTSQLLKYNIQPKSLHHIKQYLKSYIPVLVQSNHIEIQPTSPPWPQKIYTIIQQTIKNPTSKEILITGNKNTGKSFLSSYLLKAFIRQGQTVTLMDLDIGKGRGLPGTVNIFRYSSILQVQTTTFWIGEYTPLNFYKLYIESVKKLVDQYRSQYFDDILIVNTMGYLTGLGELVMIELYNLIRPAQIIFLSKSQNKLEFEAFRASLNNSSKRLKLTTLDYSQFSNKFTFIINDHATAKSNHQLKSSAYENQLGVSSLQDLVFLNIPQLKFDSIVIQTYEGQFLVKRFDPAYTDLQLLIICDILGQNLYKFKGLGYGFGGKIFGHSTGQICIKSEIVQFSKQFYKLSQKQLISLQETLEIEIPYISPIYKGLGTMGYRNLSSKKLRN